MTIDSLSKRVEKLEATIEPQQPQTAESYPYLWFTHMDGFTEQERTQLEQLLSEVAPHIRFIESVWNFDLVTDSEIDQLERWEKLQTALHNGDQAAITKHREALARV